MGQLVLIKRLEGFRGRTFLYKAEGYPHRLHDDDYYVVSSIARAFDHGGPETLVFPANAEGEVLDWLEVAGGRNRTREDALVELDTKLSGINDS